MQARRINRLHIAWLSQDLNGASIYEVPVPFHAMTGILRVPNAYLSRSPNETAYGRRDLQSR